MAALTRHVLYRTALSMPRCTGHGCRRESTYESQGGARWHHSLLIDRSHVDHEYDDVRGRMTARA